MLGRYILEPIHISSALRDIQLLVKEGSHYVLRVLLYISLVPVLQIFEPCGFSFRCLPLGHLHLHWVQTLGNHGARLPIQLVVDVCSKTVVLLH